MLKSTIYPTTKLSSIPSATSSSRFRSLSPLREAHEQHFDQWKMWYQNAQISSGTLLDTSDMDPKLLQFMRQSQPRPLSSSFEDSEYSGRERIANSTVGEHMRRFHQTRIQI